MAHKEQLAFVSAVHKHLGPMFRDDGILEIGSYDVNGSVRSILLSGASVADAGRYTGADLTPGPGVDLVKSGHEIDMPSSSLGLAISAECFEHNPYWLETFVNMIRMTRPGGVVAFTCASVGRLEHGTDRSAASASPGTTALGMNYYLNLSERDFRARIDHDQHFLMHRYFYIEASNDLYFLGIKREGTGQAAMDDSASLTRSFTDALKEIMSIHRMRSIEFGETAELRNRLLHHLPKKLLATMLGERVFQNVALYLRNRMHRSS